MLHALEVDRRVRALQLNAVWYRTGQRYIDLYQKLKREQRVLDFTDLEWSCYRLLNSADNAHWVQYKIDQRINHVLIDEFQDTNPTQWQLITPLLEEIAAGPGERKRSFFLVGDEKQSIYSFRRANPKLQQQASDYLAKHMSALDVRLDEAGTPWPRTHGWTRGVEQNLWQLLDFYQDKGLRHLLCTDIGRDGAMTGPNVALYSAISKRYPDLQVQASGGVSGLRDLGELTATGAASAITGKALLEGCFTVAEAIEYLA